MWGPEDNAIQKLFSTQEIEVLNDQLTELQTKTVELQDEISRTNELVKLDKEARSGTSGVGTQQRDRLDRLQSCNVSRTGSDKGFGAIGTGR